jgi:HrpA-like RNA helicase
VEKAKQTFSAVIKSNANLAKSAAVFSLFGKQIADEQAKVFQPQGKGVRKVIFATDVAETSLTIDGVRHVVDTGVTKDAIYDSQKNITTLRV